MELTLKLHHRDQEQTIVINEIERAATWANTAGVIGILTGLVVVLSFIIVAGFKSWREDVRLFAQVVDAVVPTTLRNKRAIADLRRDVDDQREPPRSRRGKEGGR